MNLSARLADRRPGFGLLRRYFSIPANQSLPAVSISATVLSDPRCPWCLVAHSRLEAAVQAAAAESGRDVTVAVNWQPYFLDESLPLSPPLDRRVYYESKFGIDGMAGSSAAISEVFDSEGISARFGTEGYSIDGPASSSLPALRLLALAQTLPHAQGSSTSSANGGALADDVEATTGAVGTLVGPGEALASALFECYFGKHRDDIASTDVLVELATRAQLPLHASQVRSFLESSALTANVVSSAAAAKSAGLSVPHLQLLRRLRGENAPDSNNKCRVSGGQSSGTEVHEVTGAATVGHLTELLLDLVENAHEDDRGITVGSQNETASLPVASAEDEATSIAWQWGCSDLLPAMLGAAGGSWPHENPLQDPAFFGRLDPSPDTDFYADARVGEQHLDATARGALSEHYARVFTVLATQPPLKANDIAAPEDPTSNASAGVNEDSSSSSSIKKDSENSGFTLDVLDLCSSFESHFPSARGATADPKAAAERQEAKKLPGLRAYGVGLNLEELAANSRLTAGYEVVDLNATPQLLTHANGSYNLVTCALSVDYLTQPMEVFAEAYRVLRPGGMLVIAFSDRMFRSKAVALWRDADPSTRLWAVAAYVHYSHPGWAPPQVLDLSPSVLSEKESAPKSDPLFVVQVTKPRSPQSSVLK